MAGAARRSSAKIDLSSLRNEHPEPTKNENPPRVNVTMESAHGLLAKCAPGNLPANVIKQILYSGKPGFSNPPYPKGARIRLHFTAVNLSTGRTYDDSRKHPKPMELLIGKKFKMEIWELAVHTMFVGEVAKYLVPKEYCVFYPMVAKVLRNSLKPNGEMRTQSCCAHNVLSGTGYDDLDELLREPTSMAFTFELLEVSLIGEYEMEAWYMTDEQKKESITDLQESGNKFYWNRHYRDASKKYLEALGRIEQLMNKETPGSPEMRELKERTVPLLLNHGMCMQQTRDYYEAIKFYNMALEIEKDNVKGVYRRGQCYKETGYWNEARVDLKRAEELDPTLHKGVKIELECVELSEATQIGIEKMRCKRMLELKDEGVEPEPEAETELEKQKRLVAGLLKKNREEAEEEKRLKEEEQQKLKEAEDAEKANIKEQDEIKIEENRKKVEGVKKEENAGQSPKQQRAGPSPKPQKSEPITKFTFNKQQSRGKPKGEDPKKPQ